ncbi:MAG: hypothetical protein J6A01_04885 [Proteobacteria bacterium]|nr:hypothetical protein [Pseudomonadota bacterium]
MERNDSSRPDSEIALASKCMKILCEQVGTLETERFIHFITSNHFDYTEWQREHYDSIPDEVLSKEIDDFCQTHPFHGKGKLL